MAEGRFLSKSIATSGQLKRVSLEADYLFSRMIPHADRDGRLDGDPDVVKGTVCPLRPELTPELVATCLAELDAVGLIVWYAVDGRQVVWFPKFAEHQKGMHRERERTSRLPSSEAQGATRVRAMTSGISPATSGKIPEDAGKMPRKLSEVKLSEVKSSQEKLRVRPAPDGAPKSKYPNFPTPDSNRFYQTCVANGYAVDAGLLRKALAPFYPEAGQIYTADQLDNALLAFLEARGGQPPDKARFWTILQFAQDAARWVRLGAMPRSDSNGVTERGRLAMGIVA